MAPKSRLKTKGDQAFANVAPALWTLLSQLQEAAKKSPDLLTLCPVIRFLLLLFPVLSFQTL